MGASLSQTGFVMHFERDHPLVEGARAVLGLDAAEIDARIKTQAKDLMTVD